MLLALDDTDAPTGGCTTHIATQLIQKLGPHHLTDHPRLVRLNPTNPYKTRGNAALAIPLTDHLDTAKILDTARRLLRDHAHTTPDKGAGLALFHEPPDPSWYEEGIHQHIPQDAIQDALHGTETITLGNGRGLIGALCAAAWDPSENDHTYTRIAYREPERYGTPRRIDQDAVQRLDEHPKAFDCWDPHDEHPVIAPRTPCPVLYGIRATQPAILDDLPDTLTQEPIPYAQTFVTNQATDDHIHPHDLALAHVTETPQTLQGGHVRLPTRTPEGERLDVMAFEPTGPLRSPLRNLREGDQVLAIGDRRETQVNTEKALILSHRNQATKRCPTCQGHTASKGANAPRRCPRCGTLTTAPQDTPQASWIEATPSARRHLARPLSLGLAHHVQTAAKEILPPAHLPASTS